MTSNNHQGDTASLEDELEKILSTAYYRGLDKKGYSIYEMEQDKQALLDLFERTAVGCAPKRHNAPINKLFEANDTGFNQAIDTYTNNIRQAMSRGGVDE